MPENDAKVEIVIETGTELAGVLTTGALGFLLGGPVGAAGAAIVGTLIAKSAKIIISDIANRHLSHREKVRVGAAATFALSSIRDKLKEGVKPRDDGFFTNHDGKRSSADEIFEGVLLKSKNEHQEKKIRFLGNFFANLAFTPEISSSEANHLLKIAENLTYRQMCLLALFFAKPQIANLHLRQDNFFDSDNSASHETISLYQEILDMYTQGLLILLADDKVGHIQSLSSWNEITPDMMEPTPIGKQLASLLNVDHTANDDFDAIVSQLT